MLFSAGAIPNDKGCSNFSFPSPVLYFGKGTIARLVGGQDGDAKHESVGCLTNLYEVVKSLQLEYFMNEGCKCMLLNPRNASEDVCRKLKHNVDDTEPIKYFICDNWSCSRGESAYLRNYNKLKCSCGQFMNTEVFHGSSNISFPLVKIGAVVTETAGCFATETLDFIITDDLHVMPNLLGSSFKLLSDLGVTDMRLIEEMTLNVEYKEMVNLLRLSFLSKTPLTDLFLQKEDMVSDEVVHDLCSSNLPQFREQSIPESKKLSIKVIVQKSNKKVLFAEAEEDFVEFLFSFLLIPLGSVISLLKSSTGTGVLDHLFESISGQEFGKYIKSQDMKDRLLCPKLAYGCLHKNQIFSLEESTSPQFFLFSTGVYDHRHGWTYSGRLTLSKENVKSRGDVCSCVILVPCLEESLLKGPSMFRVTDDLHVTPFSSMSCASILKSLELSLTDVEEHVVSIGLEEATNILKASLKSKSALTVGLKYHELKKPKQENDILKARGFLC